MAPLITIPIGEFFTKNPMPYFQPPTRNPPSGFHNFGGGIPTGGGGNLFMGVEDHQGGEQGETTLRGATLGAFMTCYKIYFYKTYCI